MVFIINLLTKVIFCCNTDHCCEMWKTKDQRGEVKMQHRLLWLGVQCGTVIIISLSQDLYSLQ